MDFSEARDCVVREAVDPKFVRPVLGTKEFINGIERRCIWVTENSHKEANANAFLRSRFRCVEEKRGASTRQATAILAQFPYRFGEVRQNGDERIIVVSKTSSEFREYIPATALERGAIITEAFGIFNAPLWNLALVVSRIHLVWVAAICGKMKTDYRYSNTLGWNTFPVPTLTEKNKADLTRCAENILLAREAHFPATIADLYDPETMPDDLRAAHERNDEVLERIYIGRRFRNDTERLEKLFEMYSKMVAAQGGEKKTRAKKGA